MKAKRRNGCRLRHGQEGSVLVVAVIIVVTLLGLSASLTMMSVANAKARIESSALMRAFYLADSGTQIGVHRVRSGGGAALDTLIEEKLADGTVAVRITTPSAGLFVIDSTGFYGGYQRDIEVRMAYESDMVIPGAFSVNFSRGVEITANALATSILGSTTISGMDHDADGNLLADQSQAVPAMAMNTVPGDSTFNVKMTSDTSRVEGSPVAVDHQAQDVSDTLISIRDQAVAEADVKVLGKARLGTSDNGSYGTAASPVLVYARLGDSERFEMKENFEGYGTLVLEVETYGEDRVLVMQDFARWNGLVLLYLVGQTRVRSKAAVHMTGDTQIVGALSVYINVDAMEVDRNGKFLHSSDNSRILFSSETLSSTVSFDKSWTGRVVSYRIQ